MNKPNMAKLMKMQPKMAVEKTKSDEYKLTIYGAIGSWYRETSAEDVSEELKYLAADAKVIHVHIHSPGGDAFDGVAIHNLLKNHSAEIIVHVDGYACSAASVIAMAGDKIIMPSNTMLMVHQASTFAWGNADNLEKTAKDLRKIDTALRATYQSRFKGTEDELFQMLADETWLTAEEAVALGFADEVVTEVEIPSEEKEDQEEETDYTARLVAKYGTNKPKEEPDTKKQKNQNKQRFNALLHL